MRRFAHVRKTIILAVGVALLVAAQMASASANAQSRKVSSVVRDAQSAAGAMQPIVNPAVAFGESLPVSDMPTSESPSGAPEFPAVGEEETLIHPIGDGSYNGPDPALQQSSGGSGIPPTSQNFEGNDIGESSSDGVFVGAPPDTNGDVGPNHYVQMVNTVFSVYSKTGTRLSGPTPINNLWKSAANATQFNCTAYSRGDPIVQYDSMANRWLISQFNFPVVPVPNVTSLPTPPFDQCIAISVTPDPTGPYHLYDFHYSDTLFNDYPHFGVWPDAYYMSVNQFDLTTGYEFHSAGACAFERQKMLAGDPNARQVCFDESAFDPGTASGNFVYGGQLPSDLDGTGIGANFATPPPAGEPNFFMQFDDSTTAGQDKLLMFKFHVDWQNPMNSTFGNGKANGNGTPIEIPVADFSSNLCNYARNCLPQKDSADGLDSISDRLMYRLAYRNFGDHESLLVNHTVSVGDATTHAGIRWYELRNPNGSPTVHQQSTWAPDAEQRWMGSIGMDQTGAVALGYSLTSKSRNPAIAYTARRSSDPLGQMTLGEGLLYQGLGAQVGTQSRWGDYSSMSLDPNGCTFWYTTEHYLGTGSFNWGTRIGSFTLPTCGDPQLSLNASSSFLRVRSDLTYTIAVTSGQNPVLGATVSDVLPAGVTLLSVTSSTGSCQGTGTVVCNLGDLSAGALETITLKVHANSAATLTNTATLSTTSPDSDSSNNSGSVQTVVFTPCAVPGFTRLTDPTGDELDQNPAHDIQSISVAEPDFGAGVNKLVFTLKVASLSSVPPDTTWPVTFSFRGAPWFVAMKTGPTGIVSFRYGTGNGSSSGLGDLDAGSGFTPDGTITLIVSNSKITGGTPPDTPSAGELLTGFLTRVRVESQTGNALTPDNAPNSAASDGDYPLSGNAFCANVAPTAALTGSPTSGSAPLTVNFSGAGSSDADAGDTIASYTFRFGDGSTPVTQSSSTISHTYSTPGTYHATLTVTDSRGLQSTNGASVDIQVTPPPAADLSVLKTGPSTGHVGQAITYTIKASNNGPDTATGVTITDTLPKNAGFSSASSGCAPKPKQQVVVCTIGTMAKGATATVTLTIKPTTKGDFTDTAAVSATSPNDPVSANNTSSVTTKVTP
jgi:uncharacterized repeat protein (TIGR01451 family)